MKETREEIINKIKSSSVKQRREAVIKQAKDNNIHPFFCAALIAIGGKFTDEETDEIFPFLSELGKDLEIRRFPRKYSANDKQGRMIKKL